MKPENMTILTVDDTPANIRLLTHYLEKQKYNVITAEDGFEGFKAAILHRPDLILLDVMMPGTDGYEVCELLKTEEATKDIPVVFLTAKAEVEDKIRGFELGAVDYIIKPFNLVEIAARVQTQLRLQYLEKQNLRYKDDLLRMQEPSNRGLLSLSIFEKLQEKIIIMQNRLVEIQKGDVKGNKVEESITFLFELAARIHFTIESIGLSKKTTNEFIQVDPNNLIEDSIDLVQNRFHDLVGYDFQKDRTIPCINGHYGILRQALTELLLKLSESVPGNEPVQIRLKEDKLPEEMKKEIRQPAESYVHIQVCSENSLDKNLFKVIHPDEVLFHDHQNGFDPDILVFNSIVKSHDGVFQVNHMKNRIDFDVYLPVG